MSAVSRDDGWSGLLPSLLGLILGRLEVADYIRVGAVCCSWRSTVTQRPCLPKRQSPWLMLSDSRRHPDTRRFLCLPDRKMYEIHLPEIHGRRCIGSSGGWLITIDELSELQALNPLTRASFAVPSITTFSEVAGDVRDSDGRITGYLLFDSDGDEVPNDLEFMCIYYYHKAILVLHPSSSSSSSSSSSGSGYTVAVIYGRSRQLAFAHAGAEFWIELQLPELRIFADIMFRQGQLYALTTRGNVIVFDLDGPGSTTATLVAPSSEGRRWYNQRYLVESPDGKHLFQVWRESEWSPLDGNLEWESILPGDARRTVEFAVFELDESRNEWLEVEDLGDVALFIGHNHPVALSTREFPELRSGCIYFTDDFKEGYITEREAIRDVGAFDLKDASYERYDFSEWNWPPQIWVAPSLFSAKFPVK